MFLRAYIENGFTDVTFDWIDALWTVIRKSEDAPYKTPDALCVRLTSDFVSGMMLAKLLYWFPKSKRDDGAVYKSAADWEAELGLSKSQVARAKRKLAVCGVSYHVEKAQGTPQSHYMLDRGAFLVRLAEVLKLSIPELRRLLNFGDCTDDIPKVTNHDFGKRTDGLWKVTNQHFGKSRFDTMESNESALSLTKNQTKNQTENPTGNQTTMAGGVSDTPDTPKKFVENTTARRLIEIGVNRKIAESLGDKSLDAVEDVLRQAAQVEGMNNLAGFVVAKLRDYTPPPNPLPIDKNFADSKWSDFVNVAPHPQTPSPTGEESNARLDAAVRESRWTVRQAWEAMKAQMAMQWDWHSFQHLRDARLVDFADGVWCVTAATQFGKDWLEHRAYRNIWRMLTDLTGVDAPLKFECDSVAAPPKPLGFLEYLEQEGQSI